MRARLINPEWVTIDPIDRAATHVDELGGEPTANIARGAQVRVLAQVDDLSRGRRREGQDGAEPDATIRLTFKTRALRARGYVPADGDRVVKVESRDGRTVQEVLWYIRDNRYTGREHHGPKLIEVRAETHRAKSRREGL